MMAMPARIEFARWTIVGLVSLVLLVASATDIRERRIPNWTIGVLGVLYLGWAFVAPGISVLSSLEAGVIVFVVTAALFAMKLIGAGDSKLMSVMALFAGLGLLPLFSLATVMFGGALALFSLALQPRRALAVIQMRGVGDTGRGVPYGVAIALGSMLVLLHEVSCGSSDARFVCF
jgi:prepilin peptidase CpaA